MSLTSITVGSPTLTGSSGTNAAPAVAGAAAAAPATSAVVGQTYSIDVTIVSSGAAANQQSFLRLLQHGSRAALVTSAAMAPPNTGGSATAATATLTTQLQVFVVPQSPQDQAALQKLLNAAAAN